MVGKLNYLHQRGVLDWVIQRTSAVLLAVYDRNNRIPHSQSEPRVRNMEEFI